MEGEITGFATKVAILGEEATELNLRVASFSLEYLAVC